MGEKMRQGIVSLGVYVDTAEKIKQLKLLKGYKSNDAVVNYLIGYYEEGSKQKVL